jgi:hypothetical protein
MRGRDRRLETGISRRGRHKDLAMPSAVISPGLPLSAVGGRSSLGPVVPPPPCHANSNALLDVISVARRGDVVHLPEPLRQRLIELAARPHSVLPVQARAEADAPSRLFQYYLLGTGGFEPNVFTALFPGINDMVMLTATGPDCGLPTIGSVRLVVEPKPDLPTDPNDPRAFIDIFTDIEGLFVINNESGWYEGWMIHDLRVPPVGPTRADDAQHAQFGTMLQADADELAAMGVGHDRPGQFFTTDGNAVRFPSEDDHFPDRQSNLVPIQLSMGAYNSLQQSDSHSYWEFNYTTNWIHPLYELPFTGGIPGTFEAGQIGALQSIVPGLGPAGSPNDPVPSATARSSRAIPTSSTATTTRSASSACASSPAALPTRYCSTPTSGSRRSNRAPRSRNGCSTPTRPRSRTSTRTATA